MTKATYIVKVIGRDGRGAPEFLDEIRASNRREAGVLARRRHPRHDIGPRITRKGRNARGPSDAEPLD